jgi:hypothetical protein
VKWEDLVYLVAYCPELGDFDISAPVYRRSNRLTMSFNPYWVGREVHLWGFVVDGKGRASQSQYLGGGILGSDETDTQASGQQNNDPVPAVLPGEATAHQTSGDAAAYQIRNQPTAIGAPKPHWNIESFW